MYVRLVIILIVTVTAWYFSDMDSSSRFLAYLLPIVTFVGFLVFCLWLIRFAQQFGNPK